MHILDIFEGWAVFFKVIWSPSPSPSPPPYPAGPPRPTTEFCYTLNWFNGVLFVLDSGIVDHHDMVDRTLDLSAEADNSPIIVPRLKMITHKQVH